jgi:hypothetical protein
MAPTGSLCVRILSRIGAADRNLRMAALAKRHEVALVVCSTVYQRQDVMHFLSGSQPAFTVALLT